MVKIFCKRFFLRDFDFFLRFKGILEVDLLFGVSYFFDDFGGHQSLRSEEFPESVQVDFFFFVFLHILDSDHLVILVFPRPQKYDVFYASLSTF